MLTLIVPVDIRATIVAHAAAAYPEEACGILIGVRPPAPAPLRLERSLACPNIVPAAERTRRFEIDPRIVIETQRELRGTGCGILGFYHSHPDFPAVPSPTDLPYLRLWPRTVWLILEMRAGEPSGEPRAWWLEADSEQPVELTIRDVASRSNPKP